MECQSVCVVDSVENSGKSGGGHIQSEGVNLKQSGDKTLIISYTIRTHYNTKDLVKHLLVFCLYIHQVKLSFI